MANLAGSATLKEISHKDRCDACDARPLNLRVSERAFIFNHKNENHFLFECCF